jgi:hypothetical protein
MVREKTCFAFYISAFVFFLASQAPENPAKRTLRTQRAQGGKRVR